MKVAALILTYNEEINIKACINSLKFADKIYVVDSFSTDKTTAISEKLGATVLQRRFDTYADQRNFAFNQINSEYDWILMFDADEIITSDLKIEILNELKDCNKDITSFRLRRKDIFNGKWLKKSSGYPTWAPRIFRNGFVKVERAINEEYIVRGKSKNLKEHFLHYPFNKGIHWWFHKHNNYSSMEAKKLKLEAKSKLNYKWLLDKDPLVRRKSLKQLFYRLPFRPQIMFFSLYFFRFGFLDGSAGYNYCKLRKTYEWMIQLKMEEANN